MSDEALFGKFQVTKTVVGDGPVRTYLADTQGGRRVYVRAVTADAAETEAALSAATALMLDKVPLGSRVIDSGETEDGYFVARDWAEGQTLEDYVARPDVTPDMAAGAVAKALTALADLHRAGVVHAHVRPTNIVVGASGAVALLDAALPPAAMRVDQYTSPEEAKGEKPGSATDLYRMGLVLCKAISGKLPFEAATPDELAAAHLEGVPTPPSMLSPDAPPALDIVVTTALAKEPAERYADADRMAEAITQAVQPAPAFVPPPEKRIATWMWVTGAIVILLLLGLCGWMVADQSSPMWLLLRGSQVAAPQVVGMPRATAESEITSAGLRVGQVSEVATLAFAPGTVTSQTPAGGVKVDGGSAVDLSVASVPMVKVPQTVGSAQSDATTKLAEEGLRLGEITYVNDPKVAAGLVVDQNPKADTEVSVGSLVGLTVSKGEQQGKVPNVVGLSESDAVATIKAAGFATKSTKKSSTSVPAGDVIDQSPAAGVAAPVGSTVSLGISSGAPAEPKATVPSVLGMRVLEAIGAIHNAELEVAIAWVADPANVLRISAQNPAAGAQVDKGTVVTISIGLPSFLLEQPEAPAEVVPTSTPTPPVTPETTPAVPPGTGSGDQTPSLPGTGAP